MNIALIVSLASNLAMAVFMFWHMYRADKMIQTLVDKIMSRSFSEYKTAEIKTEPVEKVKIDDDLPEDLRILQSFSM